MARKDSYEEKIQLLLEDYKNKTELLIDETTKEYSRIIENTKKCNILVIGKTGVGKSTIVNAVFRDELARTDVGRAVTQNITQYSKERCPISVYDSVGLEITARYDISNVPIPVGDIQKVKDDISALIEERQTSIEERIHLIWYCVNNLSNRIEFVEEEWIRELSDLNIPVVVVLTQTIARQDRKFIDYIETRNLPVKKIIRILAKPLEIDKRDPIPAFGLDHLIEVSAESLIDKTREIFIQQQIVNFELTEKEALKYVIGYSAVAGAVGLVTPLPGADIPLVFQTQAIMAANIINMFGLSPNKDFLKHILTVLSGTAATSITSNFLKSIPGIGTITGEMLSAVAASTITGAFGTALVKSLKLFRNQQVKTHELDDEGKELLTTSFIQEYQNYLDYRNA